MRQINGNLKENLLKLKIIVIEIREIVNSWKAYNSLTIPINQEIFRKLDEHF